MSLTNGHVDGYAIGVDGGASLLRFAVQSPDGTFFHHETGGGNPNLVGMDVYFSRLHQGIVDTLGQMGLTSDQVRSAGFGLSGVDRPNDVEDLKQRLGTVMPNCDRLWVGNDALPALRQGAGTMHGIVLIAGTGSICFGVTRDGQVFRVGGWGGELGDEGSGFWIGLKGLQAACRMADGRMEETQLLPRILDKFGLSKPIELIPWSSNRTRWEFKFAVASLFPIISKMAIKGDHAAKQAILMGIGHLVQHVLAAETKMKDMEYARLTGKETINTEEDKVQPDHSGGPPPRTKLICHGGLFAENKDFYDAFVFQLERKKDVFEPVRLTEPASLGALMLGLEANPLSATRS